MDFIHNNEIISDPSVSNPKKLVVKTLHVLFKPMKSFGNKFFKRYPAAKYAELLVDSSHMA